MTHSWDIWAYTFAADLWCPEHIAEALANHGFPVTPGELGNASAAEIMLDELSRVNASASGAGAIDRDDESTFDSDDFPKVVLYYQRSEHDQCGHVGCTNLELESE